MHIKIGQDRKSRCKNICWDVFYGPQQRV